MEPKSKLISLVVEKFHNGVMTKSAKELGMFKGTLHRYHRLLMKLNVETVLRIRRTYGEALREGGISDTMVLDAIEQDFEAFERIGKRTKKKAKKSKN